APAPGGRPRRFHRRGSSPTPGCATPSRASTAPGVTARAARNRLAVSYPFPDLRLIPGCNSHCNPFARRAGTSTLMPDHEYNSPVAGQEYIGSSAPPTSRAETKGKTSNVRVRLANSLDTGWRDADGG